MKTDNKIKEKNTAFPVINVRTLVSLIILLTITHISVYHVAGAPSFVWDFDHHEEIQGWGGEGIEGSLVQGGVFQIRGKDEFQLISPPALNIPIAEKPYLRLQFRSQSPRYLRVFWQPRAGKPVLVPEVIQPPYDRHFHTFWIPLTKQNEYRDTIEQLGLIFGGRPGWVEIDSIEIRPFSLSAYLSDQWSELWLPRNLHPGTINSLNSPRLFNKPFISWLNKLALLILAIGLILYFKATRTNRVKVVARVGLAILALWIIYDVRETFSQYKMVEEIYRSHVRPPPEKKTFPALGDFYHFVDFCRSNIPRNSIFQLLPRPYWPFDCRLKYFLYPARMEREIINSYFGNSLPKYFIVYQAPQIILDSGSGRLMTRDGQTVFSEKGYLVARYSPSSFIYKVEEGER